MTDLRGIAALLVSCTLAVMTRDSCGGRPDRNLLLSEGWIGYLLTVNIGLVPRVRVALGRSTRRGDYRW